MAHFPSLILPVSKFKAFKRVLTLPFSRLFPPVSTYSTGFFLLHFSPSFPFPPALSSSSFSSHLSSLIIIISYQLSLPPSSPYPPGILHTLCYHIYLSRILLSFCPSPIPNSKCTTVSLSYL